MTVEDQVYHRESIYKHENGKWVEYYAILSGSLWTFNGKTTRECTLRIQPDLSCAYGDKTDYRFPFWVQLGNRTHNFKCETKSQRFKWMYALRLCASGEPPRPIPSSLPPGGSFPTPRGRSSRRGTQASLEVPGMGERSRSCDTSPQGRISRSNSVQAGTVSVKTPEKKRRQTTTGKAPKLGDLDDKEKKFLSITCEDYGAKNRRSISLDLRDFDSQLSPNKNSTSTLSTSSTSSESAEKSILLPVPQIEVSQVPQIEVTQSTADESEPRSTIEGKSKSPSPLRRMRRLSDCGITAAKKLLRRKSKSFVEGLNQDLDDTANNTKIISPAISSDVISPSAMEINSDDVFFSNEDTKNANEAEADGKDSGDVQQKDSDPSKLAPNLAPTVEYTSTTDSSEERKGVDSIDVSIIIGTDEGEKVEVNGEECDNIEIHDSESKSQDHDTKRGSYPLLIGANYDSLLLHHEKEFVKAQSMNSLQHLNESSVNNIEEAVVKRNVSEPSINVFPSIQIETY